MDHIALLLGGPSPLHCDARRLFAACQVLSRPSGLLGVKHKQARKIITEILGECPKGKPPEVRPGESVVRIYNEWLRNEA